MAYTYDFYGSEHFGVCLDRCLEVGRPGYPIAADRQALGHCPTLGLDGIGSGNPFAYTVASSNSVYKRIEE